MSAPCYTDAMTISVETEAFIIAMETAVASPTPANYAVIVEALCTRRTGRLTYLNTDSPDHAARFLTALTQLNFDTPPCDLLRWYEGWAFEARDLCTSGLINLDVLTGEATWHAVFIAYLGRQIGMNVGLFHDDENGKEQCLESSAAYGKKLLTQLHGFQANTQVVLAIISVMPVTDREIEYSQSFPGMHHWLGRPLWDDVSQWLLSTFFPAYVKEVTTVCAIYNGHLDRVRAFEQLVFAASTALDSVLPVDVTSPFP